MDREKLPKMASAVRTGGKGSMCRKEEAIHKTTTTDDKRLQSTLKGIGVKYIPAIDDLVIPFVNPKVEAYAAPLWDAVHGRDMIRLGDAGSDNLDNLRRLTEQFQKQAQNAGANKLEEDDDDDVPELVPGETFEAAATEAPAS